LDNFSPSNFGTNFHLKTTDFKLSGHESCNLRYLKPNKVIVAN
jgi:hypothetical protein